MNPPQNTGLTTPRVFYGVQGRIFEDIKTVFFAIIHICDQLTFMTYDLFGSKVSLGQMLYFLFSDLISIFNIAIVNPKKTDEGGGLPPLGGVRAKKVISHKS